MKILSIICILVYCSICCHSQTKITGFIKDAVNTPKELILTVYDPLSIYYPQIIEDTILTKDGFFDFSFEIQKTMNVGIEIAGHSIFFPGTYELAISPNDSLNIVINDSKKLGILNLDISGRGAEKVDFKKKILDEVLAIYKSDPKYQDQSLFFKFVTTDRKLNVIDSLFTSYKVNVDADIKGKIRAALYERVLEGLFISAMRSEDDSLSIYFKKFIIDKNRIGPFLEGENVFYSGGTLLSEFILLSEYKNPSLSIGNQFRIDSIISYNQLIKKYFQGFPNVKDYLLSSITISYLNSKIFNKTSEEVYDFYIKNINENNPFLREVTDSYLRAQRSLQVGNPFFNFSLPDTNGMIHSLSEFKGKVLVIDFWFTGCSGCRQMAPALDLIDNKLKGHNVKFISVNVDTKETWLKGIGQYSSKGSLQLYTMEQKFHHPIIKSLNVLAYPTLFVVDRNGNLAGIPPDPRKSKEDFINFIKKM